MPPLRPPLQAAPSQRRRRRRPPPPFSMSVLCLLVLCCCCLLLPCPTSAASVLTKKKEKDSEQQQEKTKKKQEEVPLPATTTGGQIVDFIKDGIEDLQEDLQDLKAGMNTIKRNIKEGALDLQEKLTDVVDDAVTDVRELLGIEHVEHKVKNLWQNTELLRKTVIKGTVALSMVFFGLHFSHLVVFAHTVRVTGLPFLHRAMEEFLEMYDKARKTIKKEFPNMRETKQLLSAVHYEIHSTRKLLQEAKEAAKDGKVTKAEAREAVRKANVNLRELNEKSWVINQALSSMHAVAAAIDVKKVKELLKGLYTSALACFATASSSTLRGLSIGFDLASLLSRHIDSAVSVMKNRIHRLEVLQILPTETQKLLGVTVSLVSLIKGLIVVHVLVPKMTLAISSSALGALWLTDTLKDLADAKAGGVGKGALHDKVLYLFSNLTLTIVGVLFQSSHAGEEMPRFFQLLFYPFVRLERFLRSLDQIMGASRDKILAALHSKKVEPAAAAAAGAAAAVVGAGAATGGPGDAAAMPVRRRRRFGFLPF